MKKRLKQTVLVIVFILLAVFAVHVLYRIVRWKDTTGDYISSIDQLKNTPEDTIDAVFVGSSHVYCGVNPAILWEDYGYSTFDMAVSGQSKEVAYHGMVELLKTQSPKVVFVDLYALTYKGAGDIEGNVPIRSVCSTIIWERRMRKAAKRWEIIFSAGRLYIPDTASFRNGTISNIPRTNFCAVNPCQRGRAR